MDTNPWSGEKVPGLKELRDKLPILKSEVKANLFKLLNLHDVVLVIASVGAGKSIGVPSFVLEYLKYESQVICTQPRTFNASSIATSVADIIYGEPVGQHVGYRYRYVNKTSRETLLVYTTDGSMVGKAFKDPSFDKYGAVIIDEAHERNANIDLLLYLIKDRLSKQDVTPLKTKFIIMSATMQSEQFVEYFSGVSVGRLDVEGRAYPITQHFASTPITDYAAGVINTVTDIVNNVITNTESSDILVFLPSTKDIESVCTVFNTKTQFKHPVVCLPLYSSLSDDAKDLAKDESRYQRLNGNPRIKIVLSTNLAETGVTVKGIKYVVDSGYEYRNSFDPKSRTRILDLEHIAKSNVRQRMGRAGRTAPGVCYHLYTEKQFDEFVTYSEPAICTDNIDTVILKLLHHGGTISTLSKLIQPPSAIRITSTVSYLVNSGCITRDTNQLTPLGHCVHKLNTEVSIGKFLIGCRAYGVDSVEALTYAGILTTGSDFGSWIRKPSRQSPEYRHLIDRVNNLIDKFKSPIGEVFAVRGLVKEYDGGSGLQKSRRLVSTRNLDDVIKYVRSAAPYYVDIDNMCISDVKVKPLSTDQAKIIECLVYGYSDQLATRINNHKYSSDTYPVIAEVDPMGLRSVDNKILYTESSKILGKNKLVGIVNLNP